MSPLTLCLGNNLVCGARQNSWPRADNRGCSPPGVLLRIHPWIYIYVGDTLGYSCRRQAVAQQ